MKRTFQTLLLVFLIISCDDSAHVGYKRLDESVHYRLVKLGDEDRRVEDGAFVSVEVNVSDSSGLPLAQKQMHRVKFEISKWPVRMRMIMIEALQGDSIEVIGTVKDLEAKDWFYPVDIGDDSAMINLKIAVKEVLTSEEVLQLRAEERSEHDVELKQLALFHSSLDSLGFDVQDIHDGIYFRMLSEGNGGRPRSGSEITVKYKAYLSDGTLIDDTYNGNPLQYIVGKPDQVLPGFATAVSKMKKGGKCLFVLPFETAFGEKGSSSGIVPPFSALIYEAELVEVSL